MNQLHEHHQVMIRDELTGPVSLSVDAKVASILVVAVAAVALVVAHIHGFRSYWEYSCELAQQKACADGLDAVAEHKNAEVADAVDAADAD
jgi:hypothetical protein